ncbi:hypothetical protein B0H17DRAFT_1148874 [Mycena rosella]|uniref:Uncharacterized protein n=1 Tax=Mycena rosella TaxID=1033263 RepID=A0AAD7C6U9_MYCRO|nr:hypothetical protein B0H17DRAFT_1148874 [Mycena rosella]
MSVGLLRGWLDRSVPSPLGDIPALGKPARPRYSAKVSTGSHIGIRMLRAFINSMVNASHPPQLLFSGNSVVRKLPVRSGPELYVRCVHFFCFDSPCTTVNGARRELARARTPQSKSASAVGGPGGRLFDSDSGHFAGISTQPFSCDQLRALSSDENITSAAYLGGTMFLVRKSPVRPRPEF